MPTNANVSLAAFKSKLTDVARPNRFWVSVGDPSNAIASADGSENNASLGTWKSSFEFYAKSSSLPGRTVGNVELNWQGMKYNIAGDPTFDDITLVFLNNYEWDLRAFFENWVEVQSQMATNERSAPGSYKSDVITLQQIGRTASDVLATYTLVGAYPTVVSPIEVTQDTENGHEEISVTIKYDYFNVTYNAGLNAPA